MIFWFRIMLFWYGMVFVPGSYVGFYVLWSACGDDGGRLDMMGWVRAVGCGQFWSNLVKTWTVRGDRCRGRRGVVGGRRSSVWAEHCPFLGTRSDDSVTGGVGLKGSSGEVSGVRRTPRLVVEAALVREVGLLVEGEGGNLIN